jgi:predicted lipid-binding transport protein (Tim44 family)
MSLTHLSHPRLATADRTPAARTSTLDARSIKSTLRLFLVPLLALAVFCMAVETADAKRMGGGKSFGSKQSYSSNYDKSPSPSKGSDGMQRQAAPGQSGASRLGGLGGMFGGLLMGGLIGSLLFGGGFGGGFGLLELMLLGFVGYMALKIFRARRTATAAQSGMAGERYAYAGAMGNESAAPRNDGWDSLRSTSPPVAPAPPTSPTLPEGMDETEFLTGAKALYTRLQASWNRRDLEDIAAFTSPEVLAEIERQAAEDPTPDRTDILMVEARVLEVRTSGSETVIAVLFDALLREDQEAAQSSQVREVWHISRDESAPNPEWVLEGIQQLDM